MTHTDQQPLTDEQRLAEVKAVFDAADAQNPQRSGDHDAYRDITAAARSRSVARHDQRLVRLSALQTRLRVQLLIWIAAVILLFGLGLALFSRYYPDFTEEPPTELATWIAQQQLIEQLRKVQEWLDNGQAQSDQPPPQSFEELQAWLDQIELNPELESSASNSGDGTQGFVPFQCAVHPVNCPAEDVPAEEGDYRVELSRLVRNANIMLADKGDCDGTVNLVREYGSLFGWRKSEAVTKARTELSVARCFMSEEDSVNATVHYQRTFCASVADPDPDQAMSGLYGLARIAYQEGDMALVESRVQCSESLLDYHLRQTTSIATLHHYVSLALMHYEFLDDTNEAIRLQEKALSAARVLLSKSEAEDHNEHLSLMLTLQLNLMEGYITINQSQPMRELYDEINQNPLLEDSDRLVALGMLVMQALIDGNPQEARHDLAEIVSRYQSLAEFNTLWSWDAFDRWQEDSRDQRTDLLDDQIRDIRLALSPPRSSQSLQLLFGLQSTIGSP